MIGNDPSLRSSLSAKISLFQSYVSRQYSSKATGWPGAKKRIQDIAAAIVTTLGLKTPPVDLARVARLFQVNITERRTMHANVSGQLLPTRNGFEIVVLENSKTQPSTRWRFTLAHELGHTLFFFSGPNGPERIFPRPLGPLSPLTRREEGLCDAFAAALLVPDVFICDLRSHSPTMADIIQTSLRLQVTPDVLIRRLLHDFRVMQDRAVYAVRPSNPLRVTVFRGGAASRKLPTADQLKVLLASQNSTNYIAVLKQDPRFSKSNFCLYGGRTLYFIV